MSDPNPYTIDQIAERTSNSPHRRFDTWSEEFHAMTSLEKAKYFASQNDSDMAKAWAQISTAEWMQNWEPGEYPEYLGPASVSAQELGGFMYRACLNVPVGDFAQVARILLQEYKVERK